MDRVQEMVGHAAAAGPVAGREAAPAPTATALLEEAAAMDRTGRAAEAEALYRRALAADGTLEAAWHRLGTLALGGGRPKVAARCFARLMLLDPGRASAMHNLGEAMRVVGRPAQARVALTRALRLRPDYARAMAALGVIHESEGRDRHARRCFKRALALDPALPGVWHGTALHLTRRNRHEAAARLLHRAVTLAPGDATLVSDLGTLLCELGSVAQSRALLERAAAMLAADAAVLTRLAGVALREGDHDAALRLSARARRLQPDTANADLFDAMVALIRGDFAAALALTRRAMVLGPGLAATVINAALVLNAVRRMDEALRWGRRVLRMDPHSAVGRFNHSMALLASGAYAEGWPLYEARWDMPDAARPANAPPWDGGAPAGRTILLTAEQGHGDTLQFVRYAPLLAARGARVELYVQPGLTRLLAGMPGVAAVHGFGDPLPPCDAVAPLLSLPCLMGTRLDSVPAQIPYLRGSAEDRRAWQDRLAGEHRLKVGLVWAGEAHRGDFKAHSVDRRRSLRLADFAPLAAARDVAFYSLQKGAPSDQARTPPPGLELVDWMEAVADFADTAALVEQLDLVITVDTSMAHLAGAVGRPVWVLSRFDACWRWLDNRADSPWYPTMRLFYQPAPGDWGSALAAVAQALAATASVWAGRRA